MIMEPACYTRKCKHYQGVWQPDGTEESETNICEAFPEGIPKEIAYGNNLHSEPTSEQTNDIVYELDTTEEITA
jgi:hypothetical protein